ncbi:MAG: polyprenol monophosphomannose synthase [Planctomycetia bacterium]|jgi:dolichol-phosphate mannosyltransferase|nr:polyprenol monophosphomannose synthase [Planctomycetia bacterium]
MMPAASASSRSDASGLPPADRVLVIAATYQEAENVLPLVDAVMAADPRLDLLVVDDDSPDGTGTLAQERAAAEPRLIVMIRRDRRGLGSAVRDGLHEARRRGYQLAVNIDADFSHDPTDIPRLLAAVALPGEPPADVVIGSRKIPGGGVVGWPLSRHLLSRLVCWWTRWILRVPARDGSSGFRVIRLAMLDAIQQPTEGYAIQEQMLWQIHRAGGLIREVPIIFTDRERGVSKADLRQMYKGSCDLLRFAWATWFSTGAQP